MNESKNHSKSKKHSIDLPAEAGEHKIFARVLTTLIFMIVGLMALGAGVRTMNAGLSCPDWPLCFGKVIPDFHVGVYFEFIHRAYAGLVALMFFGCVVYAWRSARIPKSVKVFAGIGLVILLMQIVMGGLTVLKLLRSGIVTSHLALATLYLGCVLVMRMQLRPAVEKPAELSELPKKLQVQEPALRVLSSLVLYSRILPIAVFAQLILGGLVASTYAGSVCVDFPLCNGQWVPTWQGPIGLQVMHRFGAYILCLMVLSFAWLIYSNRQRKWMTLQLQKLAWVFAILIGLQIVIGISNLVFFIPAWLTVIHHSMAVILFLISLRIAFVTGRLAEVTR